MYTFSIKFLFHNLAIITERQNMSVMIKLLKSLTHIVIINFYLIVKTFKLTKCIKLYYNINIMIPTTIETIKHVIYCTYYR